MDGKSVQACAEEMFMAGKFREMLRPTEQEQPPAQRFDLSQMVPKREHEEAGRANQEAVANAVRVLNQGLAYFEGVARRMPPEAERVRA